LIKLYGKKALAFIFKKSYIWLIINQSYSFMLQSSNNIKPLYKELKDEIKLLKKQVKKTPFC